jgi:deoxycytidylate deaminase
VNAIDFLRKAYEAGARSPDPSNQVGAVVVIPESGWVAGYGCNDFPAGIKPILDDRDQKLKRIQHAERASLFRAWGAPGPLVMYAYWAACCHCAQDILCSPVKELWVHKQRMDMTPDRWKADVEYALSMLAEGGITINQYDGPVFGAPLIRVDTKLWSPDTLEFV